MFCDFNICNYNLNGDSFVKIFINLNFVQIYMKNKIKVVILMGSKSDWAVMEKCGQTLKDFDIPYTARVMSAHRSPNLVHEFVKTMDKEGVEIFIAAAGAAAHLAGVVASLTIKPVLGVPMTSKLDGLDSLLSTVQMPKGVPVATLAIGEAGAINAGLLAVQILALADKTLEQKLISYRQKVEAEIATISLE